MRIDYREECLFKYWPNAEVCNLLFGDIEENGFVIERKSPKDILSSILNHHIFNQAINLYSSYPGNCVIIVEADLKSLSNVIYFSKIPNITIEGVRGAIAQLYTKYHVPVLLASTRNGFVEMTNKLIEKYNENIKDGGETLFYDPPVAKTKITTNPKFQVLLQIPGFSKKKAKKVLDHYGEFSNINKIERPKGISQRELDLILEILK